MVRNYNVQGTKAYMWWAIGLLLFALWHLRDGWFPSPRILEAHPLPEPPEKLNFIGWPDNYYVYNRLTGMASFCAAIVCGIIHKIVK